LVSVNIGIFWSIGIGWIEKYSIGKNKTDPPSLVVTTTLAVAALVETTTPQV